MLNLPRSHAESISGTASYIFDETIIAIPIKCASFGITENDFKKSNVY